MQLTFRREKGNNRAKKKTVDRGLNSAVPSDVITPQQIDSRAPVPTNRRRRARLSANRIILG
jgi:hypothetical protein